MRHTPQHKALMKVVNEEKVPRTKGVSYRKRFGSGLVTGPHKGQSKTDRKRELDKRIDTMGSDYN